MDDQDLLADQISFGRKRRIVDNDEMSVPVITSDGDTDEILAELEALTEIEEEERKKLEPSYTIRPSKRNVPAFALNNNNNNYDQTFDFMSEEEQLNLAIEQSIKDSRSKEKPVVIKNIASNEEDLALFHALRLSEIEAKQTKERKIQEHNALLDSITAIREKNDYCQYLWQVFIPWYFAYIIRPCNFCKKYKQVCRHICSEEYREIWLFKSICHRVNEMVNEYIFQHFSLMAMSPQMTRSFEKGKIHQTKRIQYYEFRAQRLLGHQIYSAVMPVTTLKCPCWSQKWYVACLYMSQQHNWKLSVAPQLNDKVQAKDAANYVIADVTLANTMINVWEMERKKSLGLTNTKKSNYSPRQKPFVAYIDSKLSNNSAGTPPLLPNLKADKNKQD